MRTWIIFVGLAGCGTQHASSELQPEGPPDILQVFAKERVDGELAARLAYGDHPDIDTEVDDREVTAAVARDGQRLRVVFDELLRGNDLEEVACADGSWSRVPPGSDFDDVARCAGADLSRCEGICIGADGPVGILDENGDGAFDDTRLIDGVVVLTCDDAAVPLDVQRSYYQPSGSQLLSTGSVGTDSLGPAVVITAAEGMRPSSHCGLTFDDSIQDRQGEHVPAADIGFDVEPFVVASSEPPDGTLDVALDTVVSVQANATLDPATVAGNFHLQAGGTDVEDATFAVSADDDATVVVTVPGGLVAGTEYVITVSVGLSDVFADALAADHTITFSTVEAP
jgi:hypothetical protein